MENELIDFKLTENLTEYFNQLFFSVDLSKPKRQNQMSKKIVNVLASFGCCCENQVDLLSLIYLHIIEDLF